MLICSGECCFSLPQSRCSLHLSLDNVLVLVAAGLTVTVLQVWIDSSGASEEEIPSGGFTFWATGFRC